ncbi:MAG: sensor histidine kinase [Janthinobacterium lividum]
MANTAIKLLKPPESDAEARDQRALAGHLALEVLQDIRNPLETLGHLSYLAYQEADDPEQVRTYTHMAKDQLRHLSRVTSQTLSFAKLSQEHKPIDLVTLAESALRIHQQTIEAKRIHLVRKLPKDLVASLQGSRILQVLSNLIANALEAMPEQGQLTVCVKKCSARVELTVADNGYGIHPDYQEKLFQPFFTTKESGGNGLGLSLPSGSLRNTTASSSYAPGCALGAPGLSSRCAFQVLWQVHSWWASA